MPEQEDQHRPQPPAVVADTGAVLVEHGAHRRQIDQMPRLGTTHHLIGPLQQLAGPQPVPDRHRESEFRAVEHMSGHDRLQRSAQRVLGRGAGDLLVEREPGGHREHLGIQERHPQLQRVGHCHLVGLDQDVAAQPGEQIDVLHAGHRIPAGGLRVHRRRHVGMGPARVEIGQHRAQLLIGEAAGVAVVALFECQ